MSERKPPVPTGLGRDFDLEHPNHRLVAAGVFVAGLAAIIYQAAFGDGIDPLEAASVAGGTFVAWAIGRELDPDHVHSATVAMVLAMAGGLVTAPAALIAAVGLLAKRVLAGTTGRRPLKGDLVVLIAGAGYAGTRPIGWPIVVVLVAALFVARPQHHRLAAGLALLAGGLGAAIFARDETWTAPSTSALALVGFVAVVTYLSITVPKVVSMTDRGDQPITLERIRLARMSAGVVVIGALFLGGVEGFFLLGPVAAPLIASGLFNLVPPSETNPN